MYKEPAARLGEASFIFDEESSYNKEKGRRGSNIVRKEEVFGLVFSG
jgi:hypothetical protein